MEKNEVKEGEQVRPAYGELIGYYGNLLSAQHALLNGYLTAHSFIVLACVLVLAQAVQADTASTVRLLVHAVMAIAALGIFMSLQMGIAWDRSRAQTRLALGFLERMEDEFLESWRPFQMWSRVEQDRKQQVHIGVFSGAVDTNCAYGLSHRWYGKRAALIPWVLAGAYFVLGTVAYLLAFP